jgi:hypothetical protein
MGTPGGTGDTGDTGPMGHSALVAQDATEVAVYSVNDGPDDNNGMATIGDAPASVAAEMYFSGGVPPIEYSVTRDMDTSEDPATLPDGASDSFTLVEMDGMLVFGIKKDLMAPVEGTNAEDPNDYTKGSQFTLMATDSTGAIATKMVHIVANRAPTRPDTVPAFPLTVGTQGAADDTRKGGDGTEETPKCAVFNVCVIIPAVADASTDDNVQFRDENSGMLTFSVVAVSNSKASAMAIDGDDDDDEVGDAIQVMGMEAGAVSVTVRATDDGGLWVDTELTVTVDGAPEVETALPSSFEIEQSTTAETIVNDLDNFFKDAEADADDNDQNNISYEAESDTPAFVTVSEVGNDNNLQVTGVNHGGSATITVTATDSLGQTVTQTTKVTVVPME